jgi:type IV secretion system protein VirB9
MSLKAALRRVHCPALLLAMLFSAHTQIRADVVPMPGKTDERVRTAIYQDDQVYRLAGRIGYELDLQFAADERFVGLAAGDVQGISFEAQENHLFLKPKAARVVTNLTVLTNRRHYYLDYAVQLQTVTKDGIEAVAAPIYALRFLYPEEESRRISMAAADRLSAENIAVALQTPRVVSNRNYAYCGPKSIKPAAVTDDGVRTYFSFGARTELPAIFTRGADGKESLVNFTVDQYGITVHRVSPQFILRRGHLVGCVVNQSFDGAGDRLLSGTVSPQVERIVPRAPDAPGNVQTSEAVP